jgi:dTDP-4-amino-4,6-dideoxygalactose transaminase
MKKMISVFGSRVSSGAIKYLKQSIFNQWLGMGPNVSLFERRFASRLDLPNFLLVDSGSNALFMAISVLDLPKNSEIILPSFTWVSCAQAILMAGHKPVFCDVDNETYNVTSELIKPFITDRTGAIMVVHYGGLPCEMQSIIDLGFPVIEDAAHAVDSKYNGYSCGAIADVGIYSFDAVKNLAMGEGGGITFRSEAHYQRAKIMRYSGIGKSGFEASTHGKSRWWEYNIVEPFIKMNPSDIHAAIGLEQLDNLDKLQAYRSKIWNTYQKELSKLDWLGLPQDAPKGSKHSFFTYTIKVNKRDELARYLYEKGIYTTLRYHPLHLNDLYQSSSILPVSEKLNEIALSLPLHPNLKLKDVEFILAVINSFEIVMKGK